MWVLFGSFFMFSNFYELDSHNNICVAPTNLRWNICKNRIENRSSPYLVMVIGSACLLIFLIGYIVLQIVFTIWVWSSF